METGWVQVTMMAHPALGLLVLLASLCLFVDALNVSRSNMAGIRGLSLFDAVVMWATFIVVGYWYVVHYLAEKAFILKGPWPFAHEFCMESKEHLIIMALLLTTFLPVAARSNLVGKRGARNLLLSVTGLIVLITVIAEGMGGIISMGSKMAALP
jgi:hypothetical protein